MKFHSSILVFCNFFLYLIIVEIDAFPLGQNDLKITYGLRPKTSFTSLPTTVKQALSQGWTKEKDCSSGLNGNRYILNGDRSAMLLFNQLDLLAGISAGIPKNCNFKHIFRKI